MTEAATFIVLFSGERQKRLIRKPVEGALRERIEEVDYQELLDDGKRTKWMLLFKCHIEHFPWFGG